MVPTNQDSEMEKVLAFLDELRMNNNREWFHANRARYDEAREIFLTVVDEIIGRLRQVDPGMMDLSAGDAVFRIHRDIRFSKDKTPYKTHFSAYMARGGRKSRYAGYYMQTGPDESFLAAGVYGPGKEELKAIRQEIIFRPETYLSILDEKTGLGYSAFSPDKLKTVPKDFPKDSPYAEHLRNRHFLLSLDLDHEQIASPRFSETIAGHFKNLAPYAEFLNTAIEFTGNE